MRLKAISAALVFILVGAGYAWFIYIPQQVLFGPRYPITESPGSLGLAFETVRLSSGPEQVELAGWWIPAQRPSATIVFLHGGGSNRHSEYFQAMAFYRAAVDAGLSILTIDLRNHGESASDGNGLSFGKSEAADALAALAWAKERTNGLPVFLMGISMGGAAAIHAVANGADPAGLILLDPLLDTRSTFTRGGWAETGIAPAFFLPSAWVAINFYGLPGGAMEASRRALDLALPILLIQDPDDPVTLAHHARQLAANNSAVSLWQVPPITTSAAEHAWKGRWGSHVAAFSAYPEQVIDRIRDFTASLAGPR